MGRPSNSAAFEDVEESRGSTTSHLPGFLPRQGLSSFSRRFIAGERPCPRRRGANALVVRPGIKRKNGSVIRPFPFCGSKSFFYRFCACFRSDRASVGQMRFFYFFYKRGLDFSFSRLYSIVQLKKLLSFILKGIRIRERKHPRPTSNYINKIYKIPIRPSRGAARFIQTGTSAECQNENRIRK